jgi:hypothetical protein
MGTKTSITWLCTLSIALTQAVPALAVDIEALPYPLRSKPTKPIQVDKKNRTIEDVVDRCDIPYSFPQMVPLQGITISGLGNTATQTLGMNYFVVAANTRAQRMSEIYKENRIAGKANYVTVDCVLHPYLAYSNRVHADLIKRYFTPLTRTLLISMMQVCCADYKQAEDNDVRGDILCNMAFLGVALKLIDPVFKMPELGKLESTVQADLDAIVAGKPSRSAVFERDEDFSLYTPIGWYKSSPDLQAYYRAKTWMSRLSYPVNDVEFASTGGARANNFRRSVLLYRALDLAEVDGKPGFDAWTRLVRAWFMLGPQTESWGEKNLYCHDYRSVFKTNSADLRITLGALAEPLYRTKLLLAVRRQKPVSLGATSIFDIQDGGQGKDSYATFRLMPTVGSPEEPWLRALAKKYPASLSESPLPASLMILNTRGAARASNVLLDTAWALDGCTTDAVVDLKSRVMKRLAGGQLQPSEHRVWNLVTPLFRLPPAGVQTVLRSEMWASRRMESAMAGWLDSMCVIAPPLGAQTIPGRGSGSGGGNGKGSGPTGGSSPGSTNGARTHTVATTPAVSPVPSPVAGHASVAAVGAGHVRSSSISKTGSRHDVLKNDPTIPHPQTNEPRRVRPTVARRIARGHYVDPCPDIFQKLVSDGLSLDKEATALGFSIGPHKARLDDFVRLFQRLERIATDELTGKPLGPADLNLLAGIDTILDKVDMPLPAVLPIEPLQKDGSVTGGFNLGIGRPGQLYVILQNKSTTEWTLARGAVYTLYEVPGAPLTAETLLSKIDSTKLKPPFWAEKFDLIQTDVKRRANVSTESHSAPEQPSAEE